MNKKIITLLGWVACGFIILAVVANFVLKNIKAGEDNFYKVELSRVERELKEQGKVNLSNYDFIINVTSGQTIDELIDCDNEYKIVDINDLLYRIDYVKEIQVRDVRPIVNIIILLCFILVCAIIIILNIGILKPFKRFEELPKELAKGNLVVPIKENKNRYFGNFLWGMDLLREKLEDDRRRELELVKEKKMVLLSLSHDIKTPLSAIKLYSKALSRNLYNDEEKNKMIAVNIDEKVSEIEKFISEIVNASNDDFIDFEINNSEFYVKDVLNHLDEYYSEKMKLSQIDFSIDEYSNSLVFGDKERIIEVLQNIIENAIKYGDGKYINVHTERVDNEYHFVVSNSGCELPRDELIHIFDSFFRGSNSKKQEGSGLGLYICRKLVHLMEGEIFADIKDDLILVNIVMKIA